MSYLSYFVAPKYAQIYTITISKNNIALLFLINYNIYILDEFYINVLGENMTLFK